jgi:polyisoprenoid-binding protein YceI
MTSTAIRSGQTTWTIDPAHATVEFAVKHLMISTVRGRFAGFSAAITSDDANPANSTIDATIDVATIDTREASRDTHLKSADFFDVEQFPSMTFASKRIEGDLRGEFRIVGDLTIRGTTREVVLEAEFGGEGTDPYGNAKRAYTASTKIDRRDFGLLWNVGLETGGILVGNEVKITIEAQFKRDA